MNEIIRGSPGSSYSTAFTQVIRPQTPYPCALRLDLIQLVVLSQDCLAPSRIGKYTSFFDARNRDWEARLFVGISGIDVCQIGCEI